MRPLQEVTGRNRVPRVAGKLLLRRWIAVCEELLGLANFRDACFDRIGAKGKRLTDNIKAVTHNYRATWVTPKIERLITEMRSVLEGKAP